MKVLVYCIHGKTAVRWLDLTAHRRPFADFRRPFADFRRPFANFITDFLEPIWDTYTVI